MEVNGTSTNQVSAYSSYASSAAKTGNVGASASAKSVQGASSTNFGSAYDVNISDAGKSKGLAADAVKALKSATENSYALMIQTMASNNNKLQGWLDAGVGKLNFGGVTLDASRFALPNVATDPASAARAIADGGEWSVGAVSDRIFGLATALAGNDPEKLQQMQDAIEKGFKQAGLQFKKTTGLNDMPQITKDTYAEIMKRFDELYKNLGVKSEEDDSEL